MMAPRFIYTELTPRQREAHERSIALLEAQMALYPRSTRILERDIKRHREALANGARLIENKHVQD
jgi:hypothetical protein